MILYCGASVNRSTSEVKLRISNNKLRQFSHCIICELKIGSGAIFNSK